MIRPTSVDDQEFLWLMLFYASHSNDEAGVESGDIEENPDLVGYISGWHAMGNPGMVAVEREGPVGAAWLRALDRGERANPVFVDVLTPELAIAVRPGWENQGIGSALLQALLAVWGDRPIVLSARSDNPAVRLYERFGFVVVDEIRNRVGTRSVKMLRPGGGGGVGA